MQRAVCVNVARNQQTNVSSFPRFKQATNKEFNISRNQEIKKENIKTSKQYGKEECDKVAGELSAIITGKIAVSRPQSIAEGILIMTLAMGRVLQVLGTVMGCDPKKLVKDFCESLTKYIEMGGDSRIGDIYAAMKQEGN